MPAFIKFFFGRVVRFPPPEPLPAVACTFDWDAVLGAQPCAHLRAPLTDRHVFRSLFGPRPQRLSAPGLSRGMARLTPFEIGQIKAHLHHGLGATAIAGLVTKIDGASVSAQAVCDVKAKLEENPSWRGERAPGSGAPRKTDAGTDKAIVREVFRARGRAKVTVAYLNRHSLACGPCRTLWWRVGCTRQGFNT